jgi:outer membrane murein-binding lipoprotein Lpp
MSSHSSDRRRMVGVSCAVIGSLALAGCSSSHKVALVNPSQANAIAAQQFTQADRDAATTLTPAPGSFLAGKTEVTELGSTTPANGDVNPYAIWVVKHTVGTLTSGDVLVDNFNNKSNNQGTGTTIVDVHPSGSVSVFAQLPQRVAGCPGGVGLSTAMVQLDTGWVIVGSTPSTDGKIDTGGQGCLLVLSPQGKLARTITGAYLDGPWDAAVSDRGTSASLFVSNTLFGVVAAGLKQVNQGAVVRLELSESVSTPPTVTADTVVASGLPERGDASSFVKGPTGLALSASGTLYVADNLGNRIAAVPDALTRTTSAGTGTTLSTGGQLANPLGLVLAPNGDLIAANSVNGKIVEITPAGKQVGEYFAIQDVGQDPPGNGDLFGLAISADGTGVLLVKDDLNTLALLHS